MSVLSPLLPELAGSGPAAGSVARAAATIVLGARVVGIAGADALIETQGGRALLQGAPSLRPGAALILELQHAAPAAARTGRLVAVGQQWLEPPVPIRLQPASSSQPAATVRIAATLEVSLRALGLDDRPATPPFTGRALLRAAGVTFQVDTPVDLLVGARLQLTLPAGLVRSSAAPLQGVPLEAVRTLAASLRERPDPERSSNAGTLRLPEAAPTLAARLLRLVQLIAPRSGDANVRSPAGPATLEGQSGAARVAAALAELGRVAGEPQSGGWRVLLLPLGFAGTPLLRLYVREDGGAEDGGGDRHPDRSAGARRAVFELEFSALGRCQIDVLCQARRFDLLVRTEQPLSSRLRCAIRELYLAARDVAGLVGEVRFRAGQWLVLPEPAAANGPRGGITV